MKEEEEEGFHGIGRVARPSLADYVQRIVYIPVRWNFCRHGDTSINICAAGSGDHVTLDLPRPYANTRLHTRVYRRVRAPLCTFPPLHPTFFQREEPSTGRDFPIDRTERFVQHERKREKKLSIIEKKKDSFLIRDRFENERLRIIEGSVRKRGQWDNERRASGRYTVSLYFPWWNNAHMEEEGGWNISGQRVLCALGGKFSLAEAITKWIKHWSNVICIMGSSIRRNEIIIINYYYIYLPINR